MNGGCSIVRRFDSPRVRYLCISLFADDTNLFYCNKSIEVLEQIVNNELDLLSTWFRANKLSLNVDKTNFILFKSRNKRYPEISVHIDCRSIKQWRETSSVPDSDGGRTSVAQHVGGGGRFVPN